MKKLILLLALTFTTSMVMTSCREESKTENVGDDVEEAAEEVEDEM